MYRNPATRQAWKFFGKAILHETGNVREAVKGRTVQAEIDRDQDGNGFAVIIELERVETMAGEVLMSKD